MESLIKEIPIEISENSEERAMFYKKDERGFREMIEGVRLKTLVWRERTMLCEFRIEGGRGLPPHAHPHEQTGYLISGRMRFSGGMNTLRWNREIAGRFPAM